jgi:hypothetical protein
MIRQVTLLREDAKTQRCKTLAEKGLNRVKRYYVQERLVQVGVIVRDVGEIQEGGLILKDHDHMR